MTLNEITWPVQRAWLANTQSDADTADHLARVGGSDPVVGRGTVGRYVTEQIRYWTRFPTYAERVTDPITY